MHPHRTWVVLVCAFIQHRPLIIAKDIVTQMMSSTKELRVFQYHLDHVLITMKTSTAYRVMVKVENIQNALFAVNHSTDFTCQFCQLVLICHDTLVLAKLVDVSWD